MPKYVGFWLRFLSNLIDWILLTIASTGVQLIFMAGVYFPARWIDPTITDGFLDYFNALFLQIWNLVLYSLFALVYYFQGHYRWGTTLGKWVFSIYVVDQDTLSPLSKKQAWVRALAYGLSHL